MDVELDIWKEFLNDFDTNKDGKVIFIYKYITISII